MRMAIKSSRRDALVPLGGPTCYFWEFVRVWVGFGPFTKERCAPKEEKRGQIS
jgi:hypothetical protein